MWNIHGDDHSELVFKVCAQSGHLWPRRKLLGGWPLLGRLINNTLVKFILYSLDMLAQLINIVDLHLVHLFLKYWPDFIINRIQIQTVRQPECWRDESWCFSWKKINCFLRTMSWCVFKSLHRGQRWKYISYSELLAEGEVYCLRLSCLDRKLL